MALEHQFAVISKNSKKIYISHDMEMVCVPDYFIQYEYYGAVIPQIRQAGNRLSGLT